MCCECLSRCRDFSRAIDVGEIVQRETKNIVHRLARDVTCHVYEPEAALDGFVALVRMERLELHKGTV